MSLLRWIQRAAGLFVQLLRDLASSRTTTVQDHEIGQDDDVLDAWLDSDNIDATGL